MTRLKLNVPTTQKKDEYNLHYYLSRNTNLAQNILRSYLP